MRRSAPSLLLTTLALALALLGCAGGRPIPPEVFEWRGGTVSFAPPPRGWHRAPSSADGFEGLRFESAGTPRARIDVAERAWAGDGAGTTPSFAEVVRTAARRAEFAADSVRWRLVAEADTMLAGRPAKRVDFEWRSPGDTLFTGRDLYVHGEARLVRAGVLGLEADLRTFDRVAATLSLAESRASSSRSATR